MAAADSRSIKLWKLMNGGDCRWVDPALKGGWEVALAPTARWQAVKATLPELLATLERLGIADLRPAARASGSLDGRARSLGIVAATQHGTSFAGSIYPVIEEPLDDDGAEYLSHLGDPLARWIGAFLSDLRQRDVIEKLRRADADDCHAFVFVPAFSTAPRSISYRLICDEAWLPDTSPDLPSPVTQVWVASMWSSGFGFRWSSNGGWTAFSKVAEALVA
ncbi:MAG: hypothetical protein ACRD1K_19635 [Acidimicrobiales bacterium]